MLNKLDTTVPNVWRFDHFGTVINKLDKAHAVRSQTQGISFTIKVIAPHQTHIYDHAAAVIANSRGRIS